MPALKSTRGLVYTCFFVSGATSLVYEVVWMRQLLLTVGSTTAAVSVVLASFMAGLAAGAWLFGGLADRSRAPLRLYAALEAGIGLFALAMPFLIEWTRPLYVSWASGLAGQPALLTASRVALAAGLLALPTVFMGATFPVLLRLVSRHGRLGQGLGRLYGANLSGAVVGCLAAGFVLIRFLGVQGAAHVAVAFNFAIAAAAFAFGARRDAHDPLPASEATDPEPIDRLPRPLLWTILFFSGFVSLASEVLWTRILVLSLNSTVYSFTVILATFLLGLSLGSWLFAAFEHRVEASSLLAAAQLAAGLTSLLLLPLGARLHEIVTALSSRAGYTGGVYLAVTVLAAALLMLVPATAMGFVFPLASRGLIADGGQSGRTAGRAYLVNTIGSVAGSLAAAYALIPMLALRGSLLLLGAIQVALAWIVLARGGAPSRARRIALVASAAGLAVALAGQGALLRGPNPFDPVSYGASPAVFEAHRDGSAGSVSVIRRRDGSRSLRIDGFEAATDSPLGGYMAMMAHTPLLLHPRAERMLVICFGTGTTAGSALVHPGIRLDVVDIEPAVFELAPHFAGVNRRVDTDPRTRLVVDDGRNFLLTARERYDVVTSEPMPPNFAGVVSLYSREYYELARDRLNPGGLVVQWLPFHLVTPEEALDILRTVQDVFPETTLWLHTGTGIIVARKDGPVTIDLGFVRQRLGIPALADALRGLDVLSAEDFAGLYVLGPDSIRRVTARARAVTDDFPRLEFHPLRHKTSPQIGIYRPRQLASLDGLYGLRDGDALPLADATAEESRRLALRRRIQTRLVLAHVYRAMGRAADAERALAEGLALASGDLRAQAFFDLARLARSEGRADDARALVDQSLALAPGDAEAVRLRDGLPGASAARTPPPPD